MTDFTKCPDVRIAVIEDLPGIMALMKEACEENSQHEYDESKVFNIVRRHYDKMGAMVAVIGDVGKPLAYVLSVLDEIWYAPPGTMQLLELSLYVSPEHRKSNYAKQLMQFSKQASEGLAVDLTIGVFSNSRTEAKVRLYQRQFKQVGAYFLYHPSSAEQSA